MKTKITSFSILFVIVILLSNLTELFSQNGTAIVRQWTNYAGIQDTTYKYSIGYDSYKNVYTAGYTVNSTTGADILVTKYNEKGEFAWSQQYTSSGNNRDQATGITIDGNHNVYVCGFTYASAAHNLDYVVLKYDPFGTLLWTATYNGTDSSYDVPSAILYANGFVYLTGASTNVNAMLDFTTMQLDTSDGTILWKTSYDRRNLYDVPFSMAYDSISNHIIVTGASQETLIDWEFATLTYDSVGTPLDTILSTSVTPGFDRALSVKTDGNGNIYVTGACTSVSDGLNIKTIKLDAAGNIIWTEQYDYAGRDDIGNDLIVDSYGNVYVCGQGKNSTNDDDYILLKYDSAGTLLWSKYYDAYSRDDEAMKMAFDGLGNIVLTGQVTTTNAHGYDILTIAYKPDGTDVLWTDYFDGRSHKDDKATDIKTDVFGNIYVSGQSQTSDSTYENVSIKYTTANYANVPDSEASPANYAFYPNSGQITDVRDTVRMDVGYYTISHYPKLYFIDGGISYVFAHVDEDTATTDTLYRVDMSFYGSENITKAYPINELKDNGYLNYFLPKCPDGIVEVYGYQKLVYKNVYPGTDVLVSSNNAGMKFYFIVGAKADTSKPKLEFKDASAINLINSNTGLQIVTSIGTYEYDTLKVYQLDSLGNRTYLSSCEYRAIDPQTIGFSIGAYDDTKRLVIEVANVNHTASVLSGPPTWGTYYGDIGIDYGRDVAVDNSSNAYVTGSTKSLHFPFTTGAYDTTNVGDFDIFIARFDQFGVRAWSTYYGSNSLDQGYSIAYDNDVSGKVYVTGKTNGQSDFPAFTTGASNCYQQIYLPNTSYYKAFIIQLAATTGFPTWGTIFGTHFMYGSAVDVDANHNVFLAGHAAVGIQTAFECNADTGGKFPICDPGNNAYVQNLFANDYPYNYWTGSSDGFIAKFNNEGELQWSTLFGGGGDVSLNLHGDEYISDLAIDKTRNVFYIVGTTTSGRSCDSSYCQPRFVSGNCRAIFPLCPGSSGAFFQDTINAGNFTTGATDGFITKFSTDGQMLWSTYIGGILDDGAGSVITNSQGDVYVSGLTFNAYGGRLCDRSLSTLPGFPICDTTNSYFQDFAGGNVDAYIMRFDSSGIMKWSTWIGGYGPEDADLLLDHGVPALAVDSRDYVYMFGTTQSPYSTGTAALPTLSNASLYYQSSNADGFAGRDAYIVAFDNSNHRIWETYLGAVGDDYGSGAAAFGSSRLFVTGYTESANFFPVNPLPGAYCVQHSSGSADAFIDAFNINSIVGIDEIKTPILHFSVYPNPNPGIFTVELELKANATVNLEVCDLLGKVVYEYKSLTQESMIKKKIDLSSIANGLYILSVKTPDGFATTKLIKQ